MISRRGFLKGIAAGAGIIVAAPAIVRVESLMKLYVPKQGIATMDLGLGQSALILDLEREYSEGYANRVVFSRAFITDLGRALNRQSFGPGRGLG